MPPTLFNNELKNKEWGDYQYEVDEARSTAEKKAAKNWADAIVANGEKLAREEKQKKEAEKKRKVKEAEKAARKEERAAAKREKEEALKKGDVEKLKKLNLASKTQLLKKIGYQTKKCKWEHKPNGCWAYKEGKCPFKHNCNNVKGGTRKQRR